MITGGNGQDARLIRQIHLANGDLVVTTSRCIGLYAHNPLLSAEILNPRDIDAREKLNNIFDTYSPTHVYHLASNNNSSESYSSDPKNIYRDNIEFTEYLLEGLLVKNPECKVVIAGSVHQFENSRNQIKKINLNTNYEPRNVYGLSKCVNQLQAKHYRQLGLNVNFVILFNHESSLRDSSYLLPKICIHIASILKNNTKAIKSIIKPLTLRDPYVAVDWSSAADVAKALVAIANRQESRDYILGSGRLTKISDIIKYLANKYNLSPCDIVDAFNNDALKMEHHVAHGLVYDECEATWQLLGIDCKDIYQLASQMVSDYLYMLC